MKNFIASLSLPFWFALAALASAQVHADVPLPAYQPHSVKIPKDATYVLPDGSVYIVGNDGLQEIVQNFNELFIKTHPGFKFAMLLKGSSTGIGGLTAGVSALAPMGREGWPTDLSGFREFYGYAPLDIHIGYLGFGPRADHKGPPGIYVNAKSPLQGLTINQVTRIFTTGAVRGDITHWSQVGLKGEWAKRAIHPYGPRDDGSQGTSWLSFMMNKLPFARGYEGLNKGADIIGAVGDDPYGIALTDFVDADALGPNVRLLPLAESEGAPFADASYENVTAGRYPFAPNLHIYVNRPPGKALDPFVKEYLRLVLSQQGQAIIAAQKDVDNGFVPLSAHEVATELAKLE